MTRAALLAYIDNNVYPNANNEITALMVRDVLHRMVDFLGDAATYGVGDVALNDGGLVTGGAVQSAINTTLSSAIMFQGVTTTPLTDGSTNPNITIDGESYTAHRGDEVIYGGKEFLWTGSKWQQLGDEESWAAKTITISAGAGLTGGGNLTQNRTLSLSQDSLEKLALAASAYQLPQGGIPKTDLASAVQNSLGKADTVAGYFSNDKLKLQNLPDLYVARTQVSGTAANKTLYGVNGISAAAAADANDKSLIEWDDTNKVWHVHGGIYAEGVLSGGGLSQSSPGGGGGGLDPALMWKYLTNDPTLPSNPYANTKIAEAHLPDLNPGTGVSASYSGNLYLNLSLNYSAVAGQLGLSGMAYKPANQQTIIDALGYTPANASALNDYLLLSGGTVTGSTTFTGGISVNGQYGLNETSSGFGLSISSSGWYRVWTTSSDEGSIILNLVRIFNNQANESYCFTITWQYGGQVCITQTSGISAYQCITKIRFVSTNGGRKAIDFYWNLGNNVVYVSGYGRGTFQAPAYTTDDSGAVTTLDVLSNGLATTGNVVSNGASYASAFYENGTALSSKYLGITDAYISNSAVTLGSNTIGTSSAPIGYASYATSAGSASLATNATNATYDSAGNQINTYYLPLSGGTMTGMLTCANTSDNKVLTLQAPAGTSRTWVAFNIGSTWFGNLGIDSNYTPLFYDVSASAVRTIYHSGNANSTSVAWSASSLTLNGAISGASNIDSLVYFDTTNSRVGIGYTSPSYKFDVNGIICSKGIRQAARSSYFSSAGWIRVFTGNQYHGSATIYVYAGYSYSNPSSTILQVSVGYNNASISQVSGVDADGAEFTKARVIFESPEVWHVDVYYGIYVGNPVFTSSIGCGGNSVDPVAETLSESSYTHYDLDLVGTGASVRGVIHATTGIFTEGYLSGGGLSQSSDVRLKRYIEDFSYTPGLLMALRPREWDWNDKTPMKGHAAGFVAQEVDGLLPYMVDDTREYKALFYDQFHALEVSALQDHERRIVELEKAVEDRDRQIAELRKQLNMN